jgi:hypothetical protein
MSNATAHLLMRMFGLLLVGLAVHRAFRGRFRTENNVGMKEELDRSRDPFRFWAQLGIQFVIGAVLASGLIHP